MEFKFEEGQRVIIPGLSEKLQGIIIAKTSFLDKTIQPVFIVRWLDDDARCTSANFDQDVLERAQPGFVTAQPKVPVTSELKAMQAMFGGPSTRCKRPAKKRSRKKTKSRSRR